MFKLELLVALGLFATTLAQTPTPRECHICEFVIATARHHFGNGNITNEATLQGVLLVECGHLSNPDDQTDCKNIVNKNIDKIFADMVAGDMAGQTCVDINECTPGETGRPTGTGTFPTGMPMKMRKNRHSQKRYFNILAPLPCRECERLIGYADFWFHRNMNATQAQLQAELDAECKRTPNANDCTTFLDANIARIYSDVKAGDRSPQTCTDLQACTVTTTPKMPLIFAPITCRECERLIGYAEFWYSRNKNATQAQLQTELEMECNRSGLANCSAFLDMNIAMIYSDLMAGKRPIPVCEDIQACPVNTTMMMPVEEVLAPLPCRECERLIGYADFWFHRNMNATQAQLQAELDAECKRTPNADDCTAFLDANIARIYSDVKAGDHSSQTCTDLQACMMTTTAGIPKFRAESNCQLCTHMMDVAEAFYKRNPKATQKQVQDELEHECTRMDHNDQANCMSYIQKDIVTIYNDVKAGKRPTQTCQDLKLCS